jgi:hypothetical protein
MVIREPAYRAEDEGRSRPRTKSHYDEKDPGCPLLGACQGEAALSGLGFRNVLFPSWRRLSPLFYQDGQIVPLSPLFYEDGQIFLILPPP